MLSLEAGKSVRLRVEDYASPIVLVRGIATEEIIRIAASLCARYSDARHLNQVS